MWAGRLGNGPSAGSGEPSDCALLGTEHVARLGDRHAGSAYVPQPVNNRQQLLTLDDDDDDIFNGTPHCQEIQDGFGAHNMAAAGVDCPDAVPGDLDGDGVIGVSDLLILLASWGPCADCDDCVADLDGDCSVGVSDLLILLNNWG